MRERGGEHSREGRVCKKERGGRMWESGGCAREKGECVRQRLGRERVCAEEGEECVRENGWNAKKEWSKCAERAGRECFVGKRKRVVSV